MLSTWPWKSQELVLPHQPAHEFHHLPPHSVATSWSIFASCSAVCNTENATFLCEEYFVVICCLVTSFIPEIYAISPRWRAAWSSLSFALRMLWVVELTSWLRKILVLLRPKQKADMTWLPLSCILLVTTFLTFTSNCSLVSPACSTMTLMLRFLSWCNHLTSLIDRKVLSAR